MAADRAQRDGACRPECPARRRAAKLADLPSTYAKLVNDRSFASLFASQLFSFTNFVSARPNPRLPDAERRCGRGGF